MSWSSIAADVAGAPFLRSYVSHPLALLIHIALALWVLWTLVPAGYASWSDKSWLQPAVMNSSTEVPACRADVVWRQLVTSQHSGGLTQGAVADVYERTLVGSHEVLGRVGNLFLLTGVVGTLYGLWNASQVGLDASGPEISLAVVFSAFSITIVAVGLAALTTIAEVALARRDDANIVALQRRWSQHGFAASGGLVVPQVVQPSMPPGYGDVSTQIREVGVCLREIQGEYATTSREMALGVQTIQDHVQAAMQRLVGSVEHAGSRIDEVGRGTVEVFNRVSQTYQALNRDADGLGRLADACRGVVEQTTESLNLTATLPKALQTANIAYLQELEGISRNIEGSLNAVAGKSLQDTEAVMARLPPILSELQNQFASNLATMRSENEGVLREVVKGFAGSMHQTENAVATLQNKIYGMNENVGDYLRKTLDGYTRDLASATQDYRLSLERMRLEQDRENQKQIGEQIGEAVKHLASFVAKAPEMREALEAVEPTVRTASEAIGKLQKASENAVEDTIRSISAGMSTVDVAVQSLGKTLNLMVLQRYRLQVALVVLVALSVGMVLGAWGWHFFLEHGLREVMP